MVPLQPLPLFPGLTFPVTRVNGGFDPISQESLYGARTRYPTHSVPRYTWSLIFNMLRDSGAVTKVPFSDGSWFSDGSGFGGPPITEFQTLIDFYNQMNGATLPFLYTDTADYQATSQQFAVGDGTTTSFQLVRKLGGFVEPVYAPLEVDTVTVGGSPTTAFSVDLNGVVTFATAPASSAAVLWSGTYAWRVRFDDDKLDFSNFMWTLWELKKLSFSSEINP